MLSERVSTWALSPLHHLFHHGEWGYHCLFYIISHTAVNEVTFVLTIENYPVWYPEAGHCIRYLRILLDKLEIYSSSMNALSYTDPKDSWGQMHSQPEPFSEAQGEPVTERITFPTEKSSNLNPKLHGTLISRDFPWDTSLYAYHLQCCIENTPGNPPRKDVNLQEHLPANRFPTPLVPGTYTTTDQGSGKPT